VVLLGAQAGERITAEELAVHAETIAYEVVCSATLAVRRGARAYIDR
jgi:alanine racemase